MDGALEKIAEDLNKNWWDRVRMVAKFTRLYHRHEVFYIERIPTEGPVILISNHSFATYDFTLLFDAIYDKSHRIVRPLIDRLFYKFSMLGKVVEALGAREGSPDNAKRLLREGNIIAIAPGGMHEAIRPSTKKYRIDWKDRCGFIRLSFETQAPIVLAACPRADDLFDILPNPFSEIIYKKFKIPFVLARGIGLSPIPKPVKLIHVVSEPLLPPKADSDKSLHQEQIKAFHRFIINRMETLMNEAKVLAEKYEY